jgi:flagella basal body P-ring formation protein FlgA
MVGAGFFMAGDLLIGNSTAFGNEAARLQFTMHSRVISPRAAIRLHQLGDGLSESQLQTWGQTVVALLPPDQTSLELTQADLRNALHTFLPKEIRLILDGANKVTVIRGDPVLLEPKQESRQAPAEDSVTSLSKSSEKKPLAEIEKVTLLATVAEPDEPPPLRVIRVVEQSVERELIDQSIPFSGKPIWQNTPKGLQRVSRVLRARLKSPAQEGLIDFELEADTPEGRQFFSIQVLLRSVPTGLAARRALRPGDMITMSDLEMRSVREGEVNNLVTDSSQLIGQQVKRYLSAGSWMTSDFVGPPILIRKNDLVEIRIQGGGIVVRTSGKCLDEGAAGDLVNVESAHNKKRLLARVVDTGTVEVLTRPPTLNDPRAP